MSLNSVDEQVVSGVLYRMFRVNGCLLKRDVVLLESMFTAFTGYTARVDWESWGMNIRLTATGVDTKQLNLTFNVPDVSIKFPPYVVEEIVLCLKHGTLQMIQAEEDLKSSYLSKTFTMLREYLITPSNNVKS